MRLKRVCSSLNYFASIIIGEFMRLWFRKDISRTVHDIDRKLEDRFGQCTLENFQYIEVDVGRYGGTPKNKVIEYLRGEGYLRVDRPPEPAPSV